MGEVAALEEENFRRKVQEFKQILSDTFASETFYSAGHDSPEPDEVYPGIYIGDECCARNKQMLRKLKISHVVNAAAGKGFGMVNTGPSYYTDLKIHYLGVELSDLSVSDASRHFNVTADFIDEALNSNGKVLVHCLMGISRSSTLVLAFLMLKRNMSSLEAVRQVRRRRNIHPNDGFIAQLVTLDITLERKRRNLGSSS